MTPEQCAKSGTEFGEQTALFCWANLAETRKRFPHFYNEETGKCKMYANFNNAGSDSDQKTSAIRGMRAKQTGTQAGVFDIFLPIARHGVAGLFVEMKIDPTHPANQRTGKQGQAIAPKRGKVSDDQEIFGRQVFRDGFGAAVAEGWREAVAILEQYLS